MEVMLYNSKYVLPELPYDYSALEPYISGFVMELHHDKHHSSYVNGANLATEKLEEVHNDENSDPNRLNLITKDFTFNFAGHVNHSKFWLCMAPTGQVAHGQLKDALIDQYGSVEEFQREFSSLAAGVQGSGWAVLVWDELLRKLRILQLLDHQSNLALNLQPLLLLDVWEHAYYLDYKNQRPDYIKSWWNIVNWEYANNRFEELLCTSSTKK
ncbi:MAG: superoxide dismutase [Candidatus Ancillula sp.]|jgi:Fe-Mn family superoxide dismutase|nr:superoxide dismutase [Candidatus Ancillula sp.]